MSVDGVGELQALAASMAQLFDSAPDAMVVIDEAGVIRLVNRQTEKLFGYPRQELVGRPVEMLVPELLAGGLEIAARRKDGSEFLADISLSSLKTEDGLLMSAAVREIPYPGGVRHEFNNLLGTIMNHSTLITYGLKKLSDRLGLAEDADCLALSQDVEGIKTAAARAAGLTRQSGSG